MCFPKGGGGTTEFKPPDYTRQGWQDYLGNAQNLSQQPLQAYGGQTVSPLTPMTGTGLQMSSDFATMGSPERTAGGQAIVGAATGAARLPRRPATPAATGRWCRASTAAPSRPGAHARVRRSPAPRCRARCWSAWCSRPRRSPPTGAARSPAASSHPSHGHLPFRCRDALRVTSSWEA